MESRGSHFVVGYACAVVVAALAYVGIIDVVGFFSGALSSVHPLTTRLYQWALLSLGAFLIVSFCAFFVGLIPVLIVEFIARRFGLRSAWFYAVSGAATGLILSIAIALTRPRMFWDAPPEPPFLAEVFSFALAMVPSGAAAGFAYWWQAGRLAVAETPRPG
jgi:hypothetical protein